MIAHARRVEVEGIPGTVWGEPSDKVFIFVHGKMGKKEDAQSFSGPAGEQGYQVLSFDLPDHGERVDSEDPCTVQNGVRDLRKVLAYAKQRWSDLSLFACSLGAYFSLVAYRDECFSKCLLQSPVLDMPQLIRDLMTGAGVTEEELRVAKTIPTAMGEDLQWDYYQYVNDHPVDRWASPTSILIGQNDHLTTARPLARFVEQFSAEVKVVEGGVHFLARPEDLTAIESWIQDSLGSTASQTEGVPGRFLKWRQGNRLISETIAGEFSGSNRVRRC